MKITNAKRDQILLAIGLTLGGNTIYYDARRFKKYISQDYRNSERKQTDEIYRMFELTLLHVDSGLRIVYTTTESYFGDSDEYKVIDLFIITLSQKRLAVMDADFSKKVFITPHELIPFADVDRVSQH